MTTVRSSLHTTTGTRALVCVSRRRPARMRERASTSSGAFTSSTILSVVSFHDVAGRPYLLPLLHLVGGSCASALDDQLRACRRGSLMFSSCRRLFQHRRSSSSRHKDRSRRHRSGCGGHAGAGRRYAKRYHMIYLPDPASCVARYYFVAERPSSFAPQCSRASASIPPPESASLGVVVDLVQAFFVELAWGVWGLLVFGPSSCFVFWLAGPSFWATALDLFGGAAAVLKGAMSC